MSSASLKGRLVKVNEQERFVILDKGSTDGVRLGMQFDLLRGTIRLGRATAVRLRPNLTACDLSTLESAADVQVGDVAIAQGL